MESNYEQADRGPDAWNSQKLEEIFAGCFGRTHTTVLRGNMQEPLYRPGAIHQILYRADYFASALHEIAHWCIAGSVRRQQLDYGYWYEPDGRDNRQQLDFQLVESEPQAIEWCFARACGFPFRLSFDNLRRVTNDEKSLALMVVEQAHKYVEQGLPTRAQMFFEALVRAYSSGQSMAAQRFSSIELHA